MAAFIYRGTSVLILTMAFFAITVPQLAHAGCGTVTRTWDADNNNKNWNTDANWSSDDYPSDNTYKAIIVAAQKNARVNANITVACVEVQSGLLQGQSGMTLTIEGDYFRSLTQSATGMNQTGFVLEMAGSAAQTLELVDRVRGVHINNDTSVTFTEHFEITTDFTFEAGWSGTLYINDDLLLSTNSDTTIPAGGTVVIGNGVTVELYQNLTVSGTLKLLPGAKLKMNNGRTLTVASGGLLKLEGASGNVATLTTRDSGDDFDITVAGSINAEYFRIERLNPAGLNVTGTIQKLDHGEFHYLDNNGAAITLGAAATVPSTLDDLGFFNDDDVATVENFDASGYDVSDVSVTNWSGSVGGETNDNDGNNRINWSSPASTTLTISDDSPGSSPPNTIDQDTTAEFGTIAFALSGADTATNITEIIVTQVGTATSSDIEWAEVWRDASGSRNCDLNTGADVNITGQTSLSGSPPKLTVTVPSGDISTNSDLDRYCIHIRAHTTASAQDDKRIRFSIEATADVTNSEGYSFSTSSGPPLTLGESRINGDTRRIWEGSVSTSYTTGTNWSGNTAPTSTTDCQIGLGTDDALVNAATVDCQNATLPANGVLDFNSTTNTFQVYGNLDVASGYTFSNAGSGVISMKGAANQGLELETLFPGKLVIDNSGTSPNNVVSVNTDSAVTGDLDVDSGVLRIVSPNTLTVSGDLTVKNGATLIIEPGATLKLADGSLLDIQTGGSFEIVGSSSLVAEVTSTGGGAYTVTVDGSIEARYYKFDHLGTAGVRINSGATIDSTNHLQDGTFSYPVNNSTTMLDLNRTIPTNTLDNMTFSAGGSTATGTVNVDTVGVSTSGTLTFDGYTGDRAGISYDSEGANYLISWTGATNTINVTKKNAGPSSVDAGLTYNMGQYSFQQTLAGASFDDTDLTSLKLTLTGTGSAADVDEVRIYYDSDCGNSGGTLIGTGSFSGVPESVTFSISAGAATVQADTTTPPERCIYVEYDITAGATDGKTVGVEIASSGDFANDKNYTLSSSTPAAINLGAAASIVGAALTSWTGTTDTDWTDSTNWSAGVPTSTKTCQIDSASNNPTIPAGATGTCKSVSIGNGTLTLANSTSTLEVYGNYSNTGTFTQNSGTLVLKDGGSSTAHSITSSSTITELDVDKTGGGDVQVGSTSLTITTLTLVSSPTYTLLVPSGKTLTLPNGLSYSSGEVKVQGGGTLKIGDGSSLTVNSGGTLTLVGNSGNNARVTAESATTGFDIVVNGTISANYYTIDRTNANGLRINSGATINATNYLQNGTFKYPLANNSQQLDLNIEIPGDTLSGMVFDLDGSSVTGTDNIDTTGITGGSDSLTVSSYSGDFGGPTYENTTGSSYSIIWSGAANTILVTQEATSSGSMNAGSTYTMGRFGFKQKEAGASYSDADITNLKLTVIGTAGVHDIFEAEIYYDSNCDSTGGTLIASGSFSGSPLTKNFALSAGELTVPSHATTPPLRCVYVDLTLEGNATDANTVGIELSASSHISNDQSWSIDSSVTFPINLGAARSIVGPTTTTWDGSTDTDWSDSTNWSNGVPTSTVDCIITDQTNDPVISAADANCNNITIGSSASLTLNSGRILNIYGDFANTGTFTHNGDLRFIDSGSGGNHAIASSSTLEKVTFSKTNGGQVYTNSSTLTINDLDVPGGSDFRFITSTGTILTLPNGLTLPAATFEVAGGGTVKIGASQTVSITGGTFKTVGTVDSYPQTTTNKALVTVNGSGSWTFNASSGDVSLSGFLIEKLDANGLQISGTADLVKLDGGQFINISTSYPVKVVNLTTSTAVTETSPTDVGFYWDEANTLYNDSCCNPGVSDTFYLVYGSSCGNQLLAFDQWFGDFVEDPVHYTIEDKIYDDAEGGTCQVTMNGADSAVDLISFTATPYNSTIVLNWVTGQESNHAGFNVYRSVHPTAGFVQINNELLRNLSGSASGHGDYRFDDENVENGQAYYYMIQDVEWGGTSKMHGPVSATAESSLGSAPGVGSGVNYGNAPDAATSNNSLLDLGGGVKIVAQSGDSFRLSIEPPTASYADSTWDASYKKISMEGYSSTLSVGHPELLERTVLIEVREGYSAVNTTEIQVVEAPIEDQKVVPAPSWSADSNGVMQPSYAADSTVYSTPGYSPAAFYSVDPSIQVIGGKSFVKINVYPLLFDPTLDKVRKTNKILIDIGLDEQAWQSSPPVAELGQSPAATEGSVRIRYTESGFYEVSFEDMVAANVEGPFAGADTSTFRLYYHGEERPLEVESTTGFFAAGDKLRFHTMVEKSIDDAEDEIVISKYDLLSSGLAPLRIIPVEVGPQGYPTGSTSTNLVTATAEQDNELRMEPAVGGFTEHLFWGRTWGPTGSTFDMDVDMDHIDTTSGDVQIRVWVNGYSRQTENPTFHLALFINNNPVQLGDVSYQSDETKMIEYTVDASHFVDGTNTIKVKELGDLIPAGAYNLVYFDRVEVDYYAFKKPVDGIVELANKDHNKTIQVVGFNDSAPRFYDVSYTDRVYSMSDIDFTTSDGGTTWDAEFAGVWGISGRAGYGRKILGIENDAFLSPSDMLLGRGGADSLRDSQIGADWIVIGSDEMLDAAEPLIAHRKSEGFRVLAVPLQQLYAEFSDGRVSSQAIRKFIDYALANYQSPAAQYLLLLGDATQDPKNALNLGVHPSTMAMPIVGGDYMDYGSDNYHVADANSAPRMAVGRIPSSNPIQLTKYIDKLLDYESGARSPSDTQALKSVFYVGTNKQTTANNFGVDDFKGNADSILSSLTSNDARFNTEILQQKNMLSSGIANVTQTFDQAPYVVTYFGHGAEGLWMGQDPNDSTTMVTLFDDVNAATLTNQQLPVVLSLNCWNSKFYDTYNTIAESFVFADGGAIAFMGSTTTTIPPVQTALAQSFYAELGKETSQYPHDVTIGELFLRAKLSLAHQSAAKDTIESFTLFGDPALRIPENLFVPQPLTPATPEDPTVDGPVVAVPPPAPTITPDPDPATQPAPTLANSEKRSPSGCAMVALPKPGGGGSPPPMAVGLLFILPAILLLMIRRRAGLVVVRR